MEEDDKSLYLYRIAKMILKEQGIEWRNATPDQRKEAIDKAAILRRVMFDT